MGRVVVVFCYCYRAVKSFVQRACDTNLLFAFMVSLAGYLVKELLKVKFYDWLQQQKSIQVRKYCTMNKLLCWNESMDLNINK